MPRGPATSDSAEPGLPPAESAPQCYDTDAEFSAFYAENSAMVRNRVAALSSAVDPDDITADVMVRVYVHWGKIRAMDDPEPYVLAIAKNTVADHFRSAREHVSKMPDTWWSELPEEKGHAPSAADIVIANEFTANVMQAMSPRLREVLTRAMEGHTGPSMAVELKTNASAARRQLLRARNIARKQVEAIEASVTEDSADPPEAPDVIWALAPSAMSDNEFEVARLSWRDGLEPHKIAAALDLPVAVVYTKLNSARQKIADMVAALKDVDGRADPSEQKTQAPETDSYHARSAAPSYDDRRP